MSFEAQGVWIDEPDFFEGVADIVARRLALEGYQVVRSPQFGQASGAKLAYYARRDKANFPREQIEVKRLD